mmetsp:Transcript_22538/g.64903  ORF Transcript_22538/g.64903 Transcript_22538/m.64903 type:complete len:208 (-) Transcript_22538:1199-1822(-)
MGHADDARRYRGASRHRWPCRGLSGGLKLARLDADCDTPEGALPTLHERIVLPAATLLGRRQTPPMTAVRRRLRAVVVHFGQQLQLAPLATLDLLWLEDALPPTCGPWKPATTNVLRVPLVDLLSCEACGYRRGRPLDGAGGRHGLPSSRGGDLVPVHGLRPEVQRRDVAVKLLVHHGEGVEGYLGLHRNALGAELDRLPVWQLPID